ncbi:hypothetical protein MBLNU230_g4243t1 [Neophaeotheca triangularis]
MAAPGSQNEPKASPCQPQSQSQSQFQSHQRRQSTTSANAECKTEEAEAALKARLSRKRTKTGCLTCRRRRIKCGEERPVCRNCIKSKRHCEGYNQRVVFKPPHFDFRQVPNGGAHVTFQLGTRPASLAPMYAAEYGAQSSFPPHLMPRPMGFMDHQHSGLQGLPNDQLSQVDYTQSQPQSLQEALFQAHPSFQGSQSQFHYGSQHAPASSLPAFDPLQSQMQIPHSAQDGVHDQSNPLWQHAAFPSATGPTAYISPPMTASQAPQLKQEYTWHNETPAAVSAATTSAPPSAELPTAPLKQETPATQATPQQWISPSHLPDQLPQTTNLEHFQPSTEWSSIDQPQVTLPILPTNHQFDYFPPELYEHELQAPTYATPTEVLNAAAVESHDDNYFDVDSDEDMETDKVALYAKANGQQETLTQILAMNQINVHDLQSRTYDTFLYHGILDTYRVEQVANPLNNPATARIFAHFISATGPMLSIFQRQPLNSSVLFTQGRIPFAQQGLWTYTMPMAALHHQGLLHAMLALASLHIARLQGAPVTSSMKHYAWALKRIHHCVGHPKKRLQLTTIAASMLLGFYEIMTADHMKWNSHLMGAKQLFVETDFAGMAKQFRSLKRERALRFHQGGYLDPQPQDELLDQMSDVDDRAISVITGREVRYDDVGRILTPGLKMPQSLDLSKWEVLKDLYWWYCKQDVYQSIVSGNPLLMDYSRWADCPPRAPLGRADLVHGSFDHLILLLGRIAHFASKDRARKLRQMEANGGQWRPAPGMNVPRPPGAPTGSSPSSGQGPNGPHGPQRPGAGVGAGGPPPMPPFYGMAPPPPPNATMPSSYAKGTNPHQSPLQNSQEGQMNLEAATAAALEEYDQIRSALHMFATSLGEAFEPLSPEHHSPMPTPFGNAIFYRSYDIGCLWAQFNMATIIVIRSHPHMPPAAHMAIGIAAQETAPHANEIGRIVAAIVPGPLDQPLNPVLGSALTETCMPSFFAAVQYQRPDQRHQTILRMYNISQQTGWGTAEVIASGCETSWVRAAEAGRGPPYQRMMRSLASSQSSDDPRLNGRWEKLDPNSAPDEDDDGDRRLVRMKPISRVTWAIGIMGTEDDVRDDHKR